MSVNKKVKFWIHYNSLDFCKGCLIEEFGKHVNESEYAFLEKRPNNIIQFVVDGICRFSVKSGTETKEYVLNTGDAFIVRSGVDHKYVADKDSPCTRYWISFSGSDSDAILNFLGAKDGYGIVHGLDTISIIRIFDRLKTFMHNTVVANFKILGIAFELFGLISESGSVVHVANLRAEIGDNSKVFIDSVIKYLDEHIKENLSVKSISSFFGYERSYFYKMFKKYYGISVQEYIVHKRINIARTLVVETDMPFLVIAKSVGYDNYVSFYKAFKAIVHDSPADYRKRYMNNYLNDSEH